MGNGKKGLSGRKFIHAADWLENPVIWIMEDKSEKQVQGMDWLEKFLTVREIFQGKDGNRRNSLKIWMLYLKNIEKKRSKKAWKTYR